jgi:ABC-type multidrug transport system fused ATPase/permease subunit
MIAIIPQDIALFHRNLMENIRYGNLEATDEEVILASKKAHAESFIKRLPEGYQTMVGERGIKLSGGQRQRIAIARAILKNAPIMILDEATSALDSVTERYIQESIQHLLVGKTVFAIAHRLSTLKNMDRLIVINKGEIVESGTHEELLLQNNSLYSKIWHMQYSQMDS